MKQQEIFSLIKKYFPENQWQNALRVVMGESSGNPSSKGDDYVINGVYAPSYGLFQIRALPGRPSPKKLIDPEFNVKYAAQMWKSQGWKPWTVARELGLVPGIKPKQTTINKINKKTREQIVEKERPKREARVKITTPRLSYETLSKLAESYQRQQEQAEKDLGLLSPIPMQDVTKTREQSLKANPPQGFFKKLISSFSSSPDLLSPVEQPIKMPGEMSQKYLGGWKKQVKVPTPSTNF